jgi:serine/threonine protein phosphatase 1
MRWIIGDIHGHAKKLSSLLKKIKQVDKNPTIFACGDYCDRGPKSKDVVDIILDNNIKGVRGNHDDGLLTILTDESTGNSEYYTRFDAMMVFKHHGLSATCKSYGFEMHELMDSMFGWEAFIPQKHLDFYNNLPLYIEEDDFFIVHASWIPELDISECYKTEQYRLAAVWGRFPHHFLEMDMSWRKLGYFGHTPVAHYGYQQPIIKDSMILLDTGAASGGPLTAVCHETKQIIQSS